MDVYVDVVLNSTWVAVSWNDRVVVMGWDSHRRSKHFDCSRFPSSGDDEEGNLVELAAVLAMVRGS